MITRDDVLDVLAKCAAYDVSRFPQPTKALVDAWGEHFTEFPLLTRDLLLEAVKKYYMSDDPKVPLPGHISRIARDLWRDRYEREAIDGELHRMVEQRSEALAAPDDIPALEPGANVDPEVIAKRRAAIAAFDFRPKASPPQHCRFCGVVLTELASGLHVHPDGQDRCPQVPRMSAELPADEPDAGPEGEGAQNTCPGCEEPPCEFHGGDDVVDADGSTPVPEGDGAGEPVSGPVDAS